MLTSNNFYRKELTKKGNRRPFVIIPNFLGRNDCHDLINSLEEKNAKSDLNAEHSKCKTWWLDVESNPTLIKSIHDAMIEANEFNYKFQEIFSEEVSLLARYNSGGYRTWHIDGGFNEGWNNLYVNRCLTSVLQLSCPDSYKGGKLDFFSYLKPNDRANLQGTLLIFPSSFFHQVKMIKEGERFSLTTFLSTEEFTR
jgi:predicted 2-oxoglutarate/Fe(II)-dependent dioxygenase YbiX